MLEIVMYRNQSGITLIELVVTIVLLSIALVGVTAALNFGASQSANAMVELRAVALAQSYLDEILGSRYDERSQANGVPPCRDPALLGVPANRRCTLEAAFGPDTGETSAPYSRTGFDDVDDYHDLDEGDGGLNDLVDAVGSLRADYENFRVEVDVRYINVAVLADEEFSLKKNFEFDDEYDGKLITVTITYRGLSQGYEFSAYKSNF